MQRPKRTHSLFGRATFVTSALAVLSLLMMSAFASDARAEHAPAASDWFEIPNVARHAERDAIRSLEALGLTCRTEHVASEHVGRVISTFPTAGTWSGRGREVVLHVGVPIRVQTIVPRIRRRSASEVVASLSDIYVIALNPVRGPARHEGRVVGQLPRPGAQLPFRGLLTLDVIDNRVIVPSVEGLGLRRALRTLERTGLRASTREIASRDVQRPTVVRQRARAGSRVPYGTEIRLRVAVPAHGRVAHPGLGQAGLGQAGFGHGRGFGRAGGEPIGRVGQAARVTMPNVTGMEIGQATRLLERLGLSVRADARGRFASGIVRQQAPLAGAAVVRGHVVTLQASARRVFGRTDIRAR